MKKINIPEMLLEHAGIRFTNFYNNKPEFKEAIKRIVEAVVDKCAEEAHCKDTNEDPYNEIIKVYKPSILQVKQMINYE